jgi:hypothetical protein
MALRFHRTRTASPERRRGGVNLPRRGVSGCGLLLRLVRGRLFQHRCRLGDSGAGTALPGPFRVVSARATQHRPAARQRAKPANPTRTTFYPPGRATASGRVTAGVVTGSGVRGHPPPGFARLRLARRPPRKGGGKECGPASSPPPLRGRSPRSEAERRVGGSAKNYSRTRQSLCGEKIGDAGTGRGQGSRRGSGTTAGGRSTFAAARGRKKFRATCSPISCPHFKPSVLSNSQWMPP